MPSDIDKLIASVDAAAKLGDMAASRPWDNDNIGTALRWYRKYGHRMDSPKTTQDGDYATAAANLDLHAIIAALKRTKELEDDVAELLADAFHEIASEDGGGVMKGWWCSNGRSTAVGYAERLVQLGKYEKLPDGHGRIQWYRPIAAEAMRAKEKQ